MDRAEIAEAIALFENSRTAKGTARGSLVVRKLWALHSQHEIGGYFRRRPKYGRYRKGRRGFDLGINERSYNKVPFPERLGYLSLGLAHEGTHAADSFNTLYSELAARILAILYYRELSGPGVQNAAPHPPRKAGIVRITQQGLYERYHDMSEALRAEQLIDYMLDIESYAEDVDIDFIAANSAHWGGLKNRLPVTLRVYLDVLSSQPAEDRQRANLILAILESITAQDIWTKVFDELADVDALRHALSRVAKDKAQHARITRLQTRWRTQLLEARAP